MHNCDTKTFKCEKGELLSTYARDSYWSWKSFSFKPSFVTNLYELIITDESGNKIAQVNKDNIVYRISYDYGDIMDAFLTNIEGNYYAGVRNLSIKLENGEFIITDSYGGFTPKVINRDIMNVTEYGEKVLSECSGHIMRYDAPISNDDDHFNHPINNDQGTNEDSEVQYSPMDSTVF